MIEYFEVDKNFYNCRYVFIEVWWFNGVKEDKIIGKIKLEFFFINW